LRGGQTRSPNMTDHVPVAALALCLALWCCRNELCIPSKPISLTKLAEIHASGHGGKDDDIEILPEHKNVDLVVTSATERVWIELKTFPCNYGGSGKPITNFIAGIVADLEKLAGRVGPTSVGIVLWVAYSIPDNTPTSWTTHLRKVEGAALRTVCFDSVPLWKDHSAHMYIMEARAPLKTDVM
jgi:hypothetical protein